jgi:hypothetical protein
VNNDTSGALVTMVLAGAILFLLSVMLATPAVPTDVCLSKKEARHLWPRSHLYWYGRDHCWSNRHGPPRGIKVDPVDKPVAQESKKPRPEGGVNTVSADQFNEIDAMADADTFFEAKPFELWRSIAVVDPYVFSELWEQRISGQGLDK